MTLIPNLQFEIVVRVQVFNNSAFVEWVSSKYVDNKERHEMNWCPMTCVGEWFLNTSISPADIKFLHTKQSHSTSVTKNESPVVHEHIKSDCVPVWESFLEVLSSKKFEWIFMNEFPQCVQSWTVTVSSIFALLE